MDVKMYGASVPVSDVAKSKAAPGLILTRIFAAIGKEQAAVPPSKAPGEVTMTKVKWGVLGCASFARRRTIPAMLESPSVELVGVASRTAEKAEAFRSEFNLRRAYASYDAMLADPQIQVIYNPLPNGLHAEWMIKAGRARKHTLCEKPFAASAS
jgi:hypothetical protein